MSRVIHNADQFIVIGENIHATRVVSEAVYVGMFMKIAQRR